MAENKVKFGLKNVHIAKLTISTDETTQEEKYTYGTPQPWPGAVSISFDMQGGLTPFYADDRKYYTTYAHQGYEGDFEYALMPQWVAENIFGDRKDAKKVMVETSENQPAPFALLFEFDGDVKARRHVLYYCTMARPGIGSQTNEESTEVRTESATVTAMPRADYVIHAYTTEEADASAYSNWYKSVYEQTAAES